MNFLTKANFLLQDNPEHGVISALSDNPGTVLHQDRESPLRTPDQRFDFFFTSEGGLVCRESQSVTQQMFQDRRIYGKFFINKQKSMYIISFSSFFRPCQ